MTFLLLALLIVSLFVADYFMKRAQLKRELRLAADDPFLTGSATAGPRHVPLHHVPDGYRVGDGHSWARFEPNGNLRVGSDRLPFHVLGEPESIEIVPPGTAVKRGEPVAILRRGGRELALLAPTAGDVLEINRDLVADPGKAGVDPFGSGWIARIQPRRPTSVLRRMRVHKEAAAWMRYELARMRDLLGRLPGTPAFATMHDGGVPVDGISEHLDEERWDWFKSAYFGRKS